MRDINNDAIEELRKLTQFTKILKNPEEFFKHMQGHRTELSLVLSAFSISEISSEIIKALKKQVPKKVTHEASLIKCCTCPSCKNVLDKFEQFVPGGLKIRVTYNHCHFCGQKLDWNMEAEP